MDFISLIKNNFPKDAKIKGMIYFMIMIVLTHLLWKLVLDGDPNSHYISILGKDITPVFFQISLFVAKIAWWSLNNLLGQDFILKGVNIFFGEGKYVTIIWACSAVKQCYMFICLILFYPKVAWKKKVLFAFSGCIILAIFNILRIDIVTLGAKKDLSYFEPLHSFTQYLFYVVIFFLWVFWLEKTTKENK
ncbi:MAG: archaeosortase/exosortase family protein [Candidatus Azobacteroides sp.]|nr:archaeosortase/exosortase family protein [Candidatus Azobacteroides sp.]